MRAKRHGRIHKGRPKIWPQPESQQSLGSFQACRLAGAALTSSCDMILIIKSICIFEYEIRPPQPFFGMAKDSLLFFPKH